MAQAADASRGPAASPPQAELRAALQAFVAQSLRRMTLWMGILFLAFAPLDAWVSAPHGDILAILDVGIAALFLATHLLVRRGLVGERAAHPAMGLVTLAVLPYLAANLLITRDPVQSAGWALWQVCLSMLLLSWPWLLALLAVSNLLWGLLVLRMPPSPAWTQYVFILAAATVISLVAHGVRLRNIRHLEGMRILEWRRREELERAQAAARDVDAVRQVNQAKTRFINTAAHELSTPMTPIVLQVAVLRKDTAALTERQRHALEVLARNVDRLNALLHDVLDGARLQSDRFLLAKAPTDLAVLLAEALGDYEETMREKGIAPRLECPPRLLVPCDAKRMAQVVGNLLANAAKFTPRGGSIAVTARALEGQVRIEVADTGAGIAPAEMAHLFQPFAQVHERKDPNLPGTGLGLYISKGIVEHHGGAIGCTSAGPGQGSTFWVTLPA